MERKRQTQQLVTASVLLAVLVLAPVAWAQTTWYVTEAGSKGEDGTINRPFDTIQEGINAASNGDTVLVGDGLYDGVGNRDIDFNGKAITVQSENGSESCIIDCGGTPSILHRGFNFHSGETATSIVEGFTIRNGDVTSGLSANRNGGGIRCNSAGPLIKDCVIHDCRAYGGGAVYGTGTGKSLTMIGCTFHDNEATDTGGAVDVYLGYHLLMSDCVVEDNTSLSNGQGGGLHSSGGCVVELVGCVFVGNQTSLYGGGADCYQSSFKATNCTFANNIAGNNGGGVVLNPEDNSRVVELTNCLFYGNESGAAGGGFCLANVEVARITNCTFSENEAENSGNEIFLFSSVDSITIANCIIDWDSVSETCGLGAPNDAIVRYSCVPGGSSENWFDWTTCIDADPMFRQPYYDDFRLANGSLCIDSGDNSAVPADEFDLDDDQDTSEPTPLDLEGNERILDSDCLPPDGSAIVDMGAYEHIMYAGIDCNDNQIADDCEIAAGTSIDCNGNSFLDECEIAIDPSLDCNCNGILDACEGVEVVFIMDTSGSTGNEHEEMNEVIHDVLTSLQDIVPTITASVVGITDNWTQTGWPYGGYAWHYLRYNDTNVVEEWGYGVPGNPGTCTGLDTPSLDKSEAWGPATAIVANDLSWTTGATRVIVTYSDEAPCEGDNCILSPSDDMDAITNAINVATANDVTVFSIVGTIGSTADRDCITGYADDLATGTGGASYYIADASSYDTLASEMVDDMQNLLSSALDLNEDGVLDECECKEDINEDGTIDLGDLATLLPAYGHCEGDPDYNADADIYGCDGCVNQSDLAQLLGRYGEDCP